MKKFIYIFAATALMLGSTSCNDILDQRPTTNFIPEDIWGEETAADGYVIASYQVFSDHSNFAVDGNKFYDAFSDIAKSTSWDMYEHQYNKSWMVTNSFGKNNAGVFNCWATEYGRIKRANRLLNEIDTYGVERYDEEWCDIRRAEVRFCRAMAYFFLARVYGGVVIRTDKSGVTGELDDGKYEEDVHRARVSEAETYDFIISEMKWAIDHLPKTWAGHEVYKDKYIGRATKGMVYGFLSRVALYAKQWDVAVDAADKCKSEGGYDLKKAKDANFDAYVENYKSLFDTKNDAANRTEVIFAMYNKKDIKMNDFDIRMRPFGDSKNPDMGNVNCRICPTAELADMYEYKDGTAFDWNDPFWTFFHTDPYVDREPRFHATILYDGAKWEGREIQTYVGSGGAPNGNDFFLEWADNASTNGHTPTGYYFRKYLMENEPITTANRSYNTEIILRYAEVLLNKAEALAEQGDIPGALDAMNLVRERVGLPKKTTTDAPDKDSFMKLLRNERCCELAGEGLRFWDLRRWDMAREVIDGKNVHGHLVTRSASGAKSYQEVDADGGIKRLYHEHYRYFSLPADELTNNHLCKDNPGW